MANAGGLLTPLGDPPLLVGYIGGVPFFWTLRLFPAWLLYVGSFALALYFVDRRAYAREPRGGHRARSGGGRAAEAHADAATWRLMLAIVPGRAAAAGLSRGRDGRHRRRPPRARRRGQLHEANGFSFAPIIDVAIIFAGLFACLGPIEQALATHAPWSPFRRLAALLGVRAALVGPRQRTDVHGLRGARRGAERGSAGLVAGIAPWKLAAVSIGSVVMGATTYIGNGPNLMVKAIAERERFPTPTFVRYAIFAFAVMAPAHVLMTVVLAVLDR